MAVALPLLLAACGLRGPLYLPSKPAAMTPVPVPAPAKAPAAAPASESAPSAPLPTSK
nr:lipoprotein [Noviherbaspirillum sedimenti]